jgi:hypothetical protein
MKKQQKQMVALVLLCVAWAISAHFNKLPPPPPSVIKTKAAKSAGDTVLMARFHRIRSKMDSLYHYRTKPVPFDPSGDPFRLIGVKSVTPALGSSKDSGLASLGAAQLLLSDALKESHLGGVVTMDGVTQLTVDGRLHREGDVFAAKVLNKLVLIKIKSLTTYTVTLALEGSSAGKAEVRVRLR